MLMYTDVTVQNINRVTHTPATVCKGQAEQQNPQTSFGAHTLASSSSLLLLPALDLLLHSSTRKDQIHKQTDERLEVCRSNELMNVS